MKFLFEDETFSFETLRTTGFASYLGPIWARRWPPRPESRMVTWPVGSGNGRRPPGG